VVRILATYNLKGVNRIAILSVLLSFIALVLTQSRSSIVAIVVILLILSPILLIKSFRRPAIQKTVRVLVVGVLVGLLVSLAAFLVRDRLAGLLVPDATVNLRSEALKSVWPLAINNSLISPGYNTYQFQAKQEGLIDSFQIHSRAGADNSLLTIWVTSGLAGLILFMIPWAFLVHYLAREFFRSGSYIMLSAIASTLILFTHSQFINSLLYGHLLLALLIIVAISIASSWHLNPS